jgi:16S rRNA (cytidine1402-2'-O)-methyltransferase
MLYIISTPIGNMGDISPRVIDAINDCSVLFCEDSRRTGSLLKKLEISKKLESYNDYNKISKTKKAIEELKEGNIGLISDCGTPLISDPGYYLTREAIKNDFEVVHVPGVAAFLSALVVSGLPPDKFTFHGFLPKKKGKFEKLIKSLNNDYTHIFYESPHRIIKVINYLKSLIPEWQISISREISKKFEETIRCKVKDIKEKKWKGELVIVLSGKSV